MSHDEDSRRPIRDFQRARRILKVFYNRWRIFRRAKPLAVGVHTAIFVAFRRRVPMPIIKRAIHYHCSSDRYLKNILAGGSRYDLDGNPVGSITEPQRCDAINHLKERNEKGVHRMSRSGPPRR